MFMVFTGLWNLKKNHHTFDFQLWNCHLSTRQWVTTRKATNQVDIFRGEVLHWYPRLRQIVHFFVDFLDQILVISGHKGSSPKVKLKGGYLPFGLSDHRQTQKVCLLCLWLNRPLNRYSKHILNLDPSTYIFFGLPSARSWENILPISLYPWWLFITLLFSLTVSQILLLPLYLLLQDNPSKLKPALSCTYLCTSESYLLTSF